MNKLERETSLPIQTPSSSSSNPFSDASIHEKVIHLVKKDGIVGVSEYDEYDEKMIFGNFKLPR